MAILATEAIPIAESAFGAEAATAGAGAAGSAGSAGAARAEGSASKAKAPASRGGSSGGKKGKSALPLPGGGKAKKNAMAWAGNHKILLAEYVLCVSVLGMGLLTSSKKTSEAMPRALVKGTALSLLFFILSIASAGGKGATKVAVGLGTLVTASYVLTSTDVHNVVTWISRYFGGSPKDATGAWEAAQAGGSEATGSEASEPAGTGGGTTVTSTFPGTMEV